MLGWVLRGMSLRGTCSALDWMQEMDVEWGFHFPVPHSTTVRLWLLRLGYHKLYLTRPLVKHLRIAES